MFQRHNRCRGLRVWKWGRWQVELWFCPRGEHIEPHVHKKIDSTIFFIAGHMTGRIQERIGNLDWPADSFRRFDIPAGVEHEARIGSFCIFANFERWKSDDVTSACDDFTAV